MYSLGLMLLLGGVFSFFGARSAAAQLPQSKHVYIVAEENRSYEEIIGSRDMPYLNSLLAKGALATQFYATSMGRLRTI